MHLSVMTFGGTMSKGGVVVVIRLSVLDQSPISEGSQAREALLNTVKLAQETEKLGYQRFWVAEHHNTLSLAGSSPEVLISHIAAKTSTIRVGSGGVMLPHYSSYKVAESFRVLEALYPGRIDLGLGRAPGGMPIATRALQEGKLSGIDQYPSQLDDLIQYLHDALDDNHRFAGLHATPQVSTAPEMWLLGSSGESAMLAAERGANFAFAQFINGEGGTDPVKGYYSRFTPSILGDKPKSMVAIFVICADTDEEAEFLSSSLDLRLLQNATGKRGPRVPAPEQARQYTFSPYEQLLVDANRKRMIVGSPAKVKNQIQRLSKEYNVNEFMIVSIIHDFAAKVKSYQLLAKEFGLSPL
jgi:luciferase family oxidoreductase group 1